MQVVYHVVDSLGVSQPETIEKASEPITNLFVEGGPQMGERNRLRSLGRWHLLVPAWPFPNAGCPSDDWRCESCCHLWRPKGDTDFHLLRTHRLFHLAYYQGYPEAEDIESSNSSTSDRIFVLSCGEKERIQSGSTPVPKEMPWDTGTFWDRSL